MITHTDDLDSEFAAHILRYYWLTDAKLKQRWMPVKTVTVSDASFNFRFVNSDKLPSKLFVCAPRLLCQLAYDFSMMVCGGGLEHFLAHPHYIYRCQREPEVLTIFADGYTKKFQYLETKPAFRYFEHTRDWSRFLKDDGIVCSATYAEEGFKLDGICKTPR